MTCDPWLLLTVTALCFAIASCDSSDAPPDGTADSGRDDLDSGADAMPPDPDDNTDAGPDAMPPDPDDNMDAGPDARPPDPDDNTDAGPDAETDAETDAGMDTGTGSHTDLIMDELSDVAGRQGAALAVSGSCVDAINPSSTDTPSYEWVQKDGPGSCVFADATAASTTVTCDTPGSFTLELSCCQLAPASQCSPDRGDSKTLIASIEPRLMLDRIAQVPDAPTSPGCYTISHNVRMDYTGPSIRVRRSTGGELDIGFTESQVLDEAALTSFCAGTTTNCFIVTNYDKGPLGNHITQPVNAMQPMIVDDSEIIRIGALPVARHISPTGIAKNAWERDDILGFGTKPSITIWYAARYGAIGSRSRVIGALGGGTRAVATGIDAAGNLGMTLIHTGIRAGIDSRIFTPTQPVTSAFAHYIATYPGHSHVPSFTMRQNGALLPAISAGHQTFDSIDGNNTSVGDYGGTTDTSFDGMSDGLCFFDGILNGQALAEAVAFGDELVALAEGEPPPPADISKVTRYIIVAGQSNALSLSIPQFDYAPRYGDVLLRVAVGGTCFCEGWGSWSPPNGAHYLELLSLMQTLEPGVPVDIWWVHGESDAGGTLERALSYAHWMEELDEALIANSGRPFRWLDTFIDRNSNNMNTDEVNAQKEVFGAMIPTRWHVIDPTDQEGGLLEESGGALRTHWDATRRATMTNLAISTINSVFPETYP